MLFFLKNFPLNTNKVMTALPGMQLEAFSTYRGLRAGSCPVVLVQWQRIGSSSQ